ncbi:hypothetical protein BD779DRAFT_1441452 [Infundibulicybe gibba]|nr:hypothetical protein BD779DRAFT_1441452 [Infundibulicybe gibba]
MSLQLPCPNSQHFRHNLAQLVSPLRRVRPRVPFYDLPAHRIPTLWSLYRGLLREAPTDNIRFRVRALFRRNHHLTSTDATRKQLGTGYKWLEMFKTANSGDVKLQAVLQRYSSLIAAKREKEYWKQLVRKEVAWQDRLLNRPILTGGFLRPTFANPPLPRLKPQPLAISRIIYKRRLARERRFMRLIDLKEAMDDLRRERAFEEGLAATNKIDRVFSGPDYYEWERPIVESRRLIFETLKRDEERSQLAYPPKLLASIRAAQREKVVNKTRERERERRGEILTWTIQRQRRAPPSHILQRMSEAQRKMDKVVRSVSEVGYVAQVKRKLGFRLRDKEAWKKEIGPVEDLEKMEEALESIRMENARRRDDE